MTKNNSSLSLLYVCLIAVFFLVSEQAAFSRTRTADSRASQPLSQGETTRSLFHGGQQRTYVLHIPPSYKSSVPTPLVLIFHGFGLNAEEMIRITGFNAQADTSGFIAAYPNGTGRKPSWNGGDCCGESSAKKVDDVGFVRALIEDLSGVLNIDRKRVYATGFSNGAIMSYRLACELSDRIAAVGCVGATPAIQTCRPARPVPVIHFHGTKDRINPYDGGTSRTGIVFVPVKEAIRFWVRRNGCPEQPEEKKEGNIVHTRYAPCERDAAVELYTIVGGEHAWPGGECVTREIGMPTKDVSATALMWAFFAAHALP